MAYVLHGSCSLSHNHTHTHTKPSTSNQNNYKLLHNENNQTSDNEITLFAFDHNVTTPTVLNNNIDQQVPTFTAANGNRHMPFNHSRSNSMNNSISVDERQYHPHTTTTTTNSSMRMDDTHDFTKKNINIQAAVIHVLGDFIQSVGVFVAAIVIKIYVSFFFFFGNNHPLLFNFICIIANC